MSEELIDLQKQLLYPEMDYPHYETRDQLFNPLSHADFINMIHRYYKGEKTADLLKEYGVGGTPQKFVGRLPEFYGDDRCPYCFGMPMIYSSDKRGNSGDVVLKRDGYCARCGHKNGTHKKCRCDNCKQSEIDILERQIAAYIQKQKSNDDYQQTSPYVKLLLSAILRSGQDEFDVFLIHPRFELKNHALAPTGFIGIIINYLESEGWLRFSQTTSDDSIVIKNGKITSYYPLLTTYRLNVGDDFTLIEEVMNPETSSLISYTNLLLWVEIAFYECMEYLEHQLAEYRLPNNIGPKTETVMRDGLKIFSTSQMFNFIWGAVKDAAALYQKGGITKPHAVNTIPGSIQRRMDKTISEGWEVKGYGRNYNLPQSILADMLFNKVLMIGDKGFAVCPTKLKLGTGE